MDDMASLNGVEEEERTRTAWENSALTAHCKARQKRRDARTVQLVNLFITGCVLAILKPGSLHARAKPVNTL